MKRVVVGILLMAVCGTASAIAVQPADVITLGTPVRTSLLGYDVPVYIQDVSGSPLGIDQPAGSRIQSYSIKVNYAPAAPIQSITFTRAGITAPLTPVFESSPATSGSISLLDTFHEATNLVPFTSNATAPGNQIGVLHVAFTGSATAGTVVTLTLDPTLTQLTNEGGTTIETVANVTLLLVNASVTVPAVVPMLDARMLALLAAALISIAVFLRRL